MGDDPRNLCRTRPRGSPKVACAALNVALADGVDEFPLALYHLGLPSVANESFFPEVLEFGDGTENVEGAPSVADESFIQEVIESEDEPHTIKTQHLWLNLITSLT